MVKKSMISNSMAQKIKKNETLIFFGAVQKGRGKATFFFLGIQLCVVLLLSFSAKLKRGTLGEKPPVVYSAFLLLFVTP